MNCDATREILSGVLGLPRAKCSLAAELRGTLDLPGVKIEKWLFASEMGSLVPCNLWLPTNPATEHLPAVLLTCGHGESKSAPVIQLAAHLFSQLGFACLAADPPGEEERHPSGGLGTREHDQPDVGARCLASGRPILGKMVWDAIRAIDFLEADRRVDPARIAVAGNSLGGAVASFLAPVERRLRAVIISGWALDDEMLTSGKNCTRIPCQQLRMHLAWDAMVRTAANHAALLFANGDRDEIIDQTGDGAVWQRMRGLTKNLSATCRCAVDDMWWRDGGHRPYYLARATLKWLADRLEFPQASRQLDSLPDIPLGSWADRVGISFEPLYNSAHHLRGLEVPDAGFLLLPPAQLACLNLHEVGQNPFTIGGWLKEISRMPPGGSSHPGKGSNSVRSRG